MEMMIKMEIMESSEVLNSIAYNAPIFQFLPVLAGILKIKYIPNYIIFLVGTFLVVAFGDQVMKYFFDLKYQNMWVSNIMIYMQIPLFLAFFMSLGLKKFISKVFLIILFTILFLFGTYRTFLNGNILDYKKLVYASTCIIYMISSFIYLFDFVISSDLDISKIPRKIYLTTSIIFYYSITVGAYFADNPHDGFNQITWLVRNLTLIIYCTLISIIIWQYKEVVHDKK